jgi:hypothetical protein
MWGTFLSEPLRIVALVGRYPPNKLMRRMPVRPRPEAFPRRPCGHRGVWGIRRDFSRLSPWDGWVAYVLLTRAPVADSGIATASLPLDLHVLGLSLAFILSQDQTLRCCIYLFLSFSLCRAPVYLARLRPTPWSGYRLSLPRSIAARFPDSFSTWTRNRLIAFAFLVSLLFPVLLCLS